MLGLTSGGLPSAEPSPSPRRPRLLWRWVRWLLVTALVAVLGLALFHRPLLLWTLNRWGPSLALSSGYALDWKVDGSLWSDLRVTQLSLAGPGVKTVKAGTLRLDYDLGPAMRGDYFSIAKTVTLHDAELELDLSQPSAPKPGPAQPTDFASLGKTLRALHWPQLDLQNVNLTLYLPADVTLKLIGLQLRLPSAAGEKGRLEIQSIQHPALKDYPLEGIAADLVFSGQTLTVQNLSLPQGLTLEELKVDATDLATGLIRPSLNARLGEGKLALSGSVDLSKPEPAVDLVVQLETLSSSALPVALPVKFQLDQVRVSVKGNPTSPKGLTAAAAVTGRDLKHGAYAVDGFELKALLQDQRLQLEKLDAEVGSNRLHLEATAAVGERWGDLPQAEVQARWSLESPDLAQLSGLPVSAAVAGKLTASGTAELSAGLPRRFSLALAGENLAAQGQQLRELKLTAEGTRELVRFTAVAAPTAAVSGRLETKGELHLKGSETSVVDWNLVVPKPLLLAGLAGAKLPEALGLGQLTSSGTARFVLPEMLKGDLTKLQSNGELRVMAPAWQALQTEQLALSWTLADGLVKLPTLTLDLAGENRLSVTGQLAVAGEQGFRGEVDLQLPQVQKLSAALKGFGVPELGGGAVRLHWTGSGQLKALETLRGEGMLAVEALVTAALPEPASLKSSFRHDLKSAELESLDLSMGSSRLSLKGKVNQERLVLSELQLRGGGQTLLTGKADLPADYQQAPLQLSLAMPQPLDVAQLARLARQSLPKGVSGTVAFAAEFSGTLEKLAGTVDLKASELVIPHPQAKEPGEVAVALSMTDGVAKLQTRAVVLPLEPFILEASVPLNLPKLLAEPASWKALPLTAKVKHQQPQIAFLKPLVPILAELEGSVDLDLSVSGSLGQPTWKGGLNVALPKVIPKNPDLPSIRDLRLQLNADNRLVTLTTLKADVSGGAVELTGKADMTELAKPRFDLKLTARDLLVMRNENISLRTDADLVCAGVPDEASLSGVVALTRGRVLQEVDFLPLGKMMNDLPPLPDQKVKLGAPGTEPPPIPEILKKWTFDVAMKTKDNIRLLGNVIAGGVAIDLKASGTGVAPVLTGQVKTHEAVINLPFSTLRIQRGEVTFPADRLLAPTLELHAESTVDKYEIALRGWGSAFDPKTLFSSTPPLPEGEIATLLATGSTTSGLVNGGDVAGRALLFLVRESIRKMSKSNEKRRARSGEKRDGGRFILQERSESGKLGGFTGIYEFSRKMKLMGSTNNDGGFRAMMQYLFRFD